MARYRFQPWPEHPIENITLQKRPSQQRKPQKRKHHKRARDLNAINSARHAARIDVFVAKAIAGIRFARQLPPFPSS